MRVATLAVLVALAVAACGNDEVIFDAPIDAATDGGVDGDPPDAPVDAAVDAAIDASICGTCGPNQVCVAYHDGTCSPNILVECQDRNPGCQGTVCQQGSDCEFWHCKRGQDAGSIYICYSCPNDVAGALNCHGP
jgi:hypothetical protein